MGNWDEFVRTGGWDVGASLPMALGGWKQPTGQWRMAAPSAARTPYDKSSSGVIPVGARG